ncbi:MAG: hypothetical protein OXB92_17310, partial [Acidimicrobiaceae bacterium]|nr:hypothetical protein [Acidimicrobiaceae bacterium]
MDFCPLIRAEIDGTRNLVETARSDSRLFAAERSLLRALANSFSIIGRKRKFEQPGGRGIWQSMRRKPTAPGRDRAKVGLLRKRRVEP